MSKENSMLTKMIMLACLILVAVLSVTVVAKRATSPETHSATLETLDEKKATAMKVTAAVAATSTAISMIPGDTATPIAEQVSELTTPLLLVVCAIYLEKYLLITIGYISFNILIPIVCILGGVYIFYKNSQLKALAVRLLILAISLYAIIPLSTKAMDLVEKTFENSVSETYGKVDEIAEEAEKSAEEEDSNAFIDFLTGLGDSVSGFVENAKNAVGIFIDAIAVLIITTCLIPILVILCFIWITKILLGLGRL